MIIRRRTYAKRFTGNYGYFMLNADFQLMDREEGNTWNFITNIYTNNCTNESLVGNFPYSYRLADKVTGNSYLTSFAVGYTVNSGTIIVATPRHIYLSNNRGNTWTTVCTLPTYSYWYTRFIPILYADGNNYYLVYAIRSRLVSDSDSDKSSYIYMYEYHWNGSSGSTTLLKTVYALWDYDLSTTSGLYSNKTSPHGQMLLRYNTEPDDYRYVKYFMLDIPRKLVSQYSSETLLQLGALYGGFEGAGMWINDGTTYGAWIVGFLGFRDGENWRYSYYKCPASNFSSSTLPVLTNINADISTLMNLDTDYQSPLMCVATAETYKNLIFWQVGVSFGDKGMSWWTSKANFTDFQRIDISKIPNSLRNMETSGLYVSPDGKYGFMMGVWETLVFDLETRKFIDGLTRRDLENFIPTYNGIYTTFMLPRFIV